MRGRFPMHFEVEVLNMSLTGLAVECQRPLEIGKQYEFMLLTGAERVELTLSSPFTLDGQLFEADPATPLVLTAEHSAEFVRL